jgi:epoxyqueuosine reductase
MLTSEEIKTYANYLGFHGVGIARVGTYPDQAVENLQTWLAWGYHGEMDWMTNPKRQDIRACFPEVKSVIALALNYYTDHQRPQGKEYAKISRYGWGRDYHKVLLKKLRNFSRWLEAQYPEIQTRYYGDTGPIQDKVWAQRAGIGWIAKNGNLITRKYGSWVFLGEILINIELEADKPHTNHCGTCRRCLDACPTGAIPQPYFVDANRCIAYHTIENRSQELPEAIASKLDNWVAGCDICQDVCPWNQRFAQDTDINEFQPYSWNIDPKLQELASLDHGEWNRRFPASALRRIKPFMWRRNAGANLSTLKLSPDKT